MNKNGLITKVAAGLIFALIVGAWSILYTRVESLSHIHVAQGERVRAMEILYDSIQRDFTRIDQRLERIENKLDAQRK